MSGTRQNLLVDSFGRHGEKLRVSVTDRCNLRCFYCMPRGQISWVPRREILHYGEIAELTRILAHLGIRKVRLTGGEPLVRPELERLVRMLKRIPGIEQVSMTTNGSFLSDRAKILRGAGLDSVNISLDTLKRERFREMTGVDGWDQVMRGIEAAAEAGFSPIKINTVVVRGYNEDEAADLVIWAGQNGFEIRFIEFMPLDGPGAWRMESVVTAKEIISSLSAIGQVTRLPKKTNEPAQPYLFEGKDVQTRVGFIASVSEPFCMNCDRIRLTARGTLRSCLFGTEELDLGTMLREEVPEEEIAEAIKEFIARKPAGHRIGQKGFERPPVAMNYLGG